MHVKWQNVEQCIGNKLYKELGSYQVKDTFLYSGIILADINHRFAFSGRTKLTEIYLHNLYLIAHLTLKLTGAALQPECSYWQYSEQNKSVCNGQD